MNIGRVIKELRVERGLSQIELSLKCDLTQTALSQIETGSKRPSTTTLNKLCSFFEVPEMAIYLLATDESDIPDSKRQVFNILFPTMKKIIGDIFEINLK